MKIATGPPLFSGGRKSDTIAVPILRPGLANKPAKNLQTMSEVIVCENPAPNVNAARPGSAQIYTAFLPNVSLEGPATMGPKDSPRR